ncbi:MAG: UxaA family hydrolase [Desulfobacteraceae bacterium]|nr:UxaA family hydrolase [Desulfobacteraceae bacterium]
MKFLGYPRPNGSAGIRNYVLVIPGGMFATKICDFVAGTRTIVTADSGGGRTGRDRQTVARTLIGLGKNPNVASVIVHSQSRGAGYPELKLSYIAEEIARSGKWVEYIDNAQEGGTLRALEKGIQTARKMVLEASRIRRQPFDLSHLAVGVKCGHSDTTSGIAGNPVIGNLFDRIVQAGGTAFFGENTEIIGAEHVLAKRGINQEVASRILDVAAETEKIAKSTGEDIRTINPVPSNIAGGISTLEEKSLGAIHKSGSAPIQGVLQYGEQPPSKGLYFVDNWMSSTSIFAGYAAAGAQLVIFQLGGGGLSGEDLLYTSTAVVSPLMWTTANPKTLAMAPTSLDFYSGTVIEGKETIEEAGEKLLQTVLEIAAGTLTKVETIKYISPTQIYLRDPCF